MKFEMTVTEFAAFVSQIQFGARVPQLESDLEKLRSELEETKAMHDVVCEDRDYIQRRLNQTVKENDNLERQRLEVQREIRELKLAIRVEQDKLIPNRKERMLSNIFHLHTTGQKIYAIKALRELYHPFGLKEAKECVEGVAPQSGNVRDEIHREISELALIFRDLGKTSVDVQCERLLPFVNVSADKLESILNGTFKVPTDSEQVDQATGLVRL